MTAGLRVLRLLGATVGLLLLVIGIAVTAQSTTTAAWTDPMNLTAAASAGQWSVHTPSDIVLVPGNEYTVIDGTQWAVAETPGNLDFCVTIAITGVQSEPQVWELRADMSLPPFNGMTGTSNIFYSGSTQVSFSNLEDDPSTLVIRGAGSGDPWNANWSNALLTDQQTLHVTICVSYAPVPATGEPSWYETTQGPSGTWTDTLACVRLDATGLVTDLEANPFYFAWTATLDLTDAKTHITGAGKTLNYVSWSPSPSNGYQFTINPTTTNPPPDSYVIDSGRMTALRGTNTTVITACVHGY